MWHSSHAELSNLPSLIIIIILIFFSSLSLFCFSFFLFTSSSSISLLLCLSGSRRSLRGRWRGPTKGLEWKISRVRKESWREKQKGRAKRSFQTDRVELESSDLVARRRSG
ncbi:hypothetical protein RchiOBHm_Chr2g0141801 [Rosa chinensis]|uniref:Transmembrane protein n=1 Tax=Rosa chinensis TaxID=74649 RepID=A0A2P6RXQ7_ROSCH|nr:hypothetical protein RchiOBHm_Chr2g0141801 [Rosa chinensis]